MLTTDDEALPLAYSVLRAAELIGVSKPKIYEFINRGQLRARTIGVRADGRAGRTLILRSDLVAFLDALPDHYLADDQ